MPCECGLLPKGGRQRNLRLSLYEFLVKGFKGLLWLPAPYSQFLGPAVEQRESGKETGALVHSKVANLPWTKALFFLVMENRTHDLALFQAGTCVTELYPWPQFFQV